MKLPHIDLDHLLHLDVSALDFDGYGDLLSELDAPHFDPATMQAIRRFAASGGGVWQRTVKFQ